MICYIHYILFTKRGLVYRGKGIITLISAIFNSSCVLRVQQSATRCANTNGRMKCIATLFSYILLCVIWLNIFFLYNVNGNTVPWYENLPAVAMDYKVHIDPGKEDCYFQYVNPGATFYVSFQVVRGGDGMAGFAVRHPSGQIVHPYQWKPSSEYQDERSVGGYYSVCIDNQFSRFADKLVNLYITVVRYDQWEKYTQELEAINLNIENFTSTIITVERNINDMLQYQYHSRGREARDYNLLQGNNSYVIRWSIAQIFVIAFTTAVQVYFVRKLFDIKTGTNTKSRI